MTVIVGLGLPEELRAEAVAIYWQAFGGKLGRILGPDDRAMAFLMRTISTKKCMVALSADGRLLGLAGFKTRTGAFTGGSFADLTAIYGRGGALWRAAIFRLLQSDLDNRRFLIDGICVLREARSQGIGTTLLNAICEEARLRGYHAVRLEVVDTNWRARALYERLGFAPVQTSGIGLLRYVFGFEAATTMVKPLPAG